MKRTNTQRYGYSRLPIVLALCAATSAQAVELGLFADVTYANGNAKGEPGGFALGQFDVFASHQINERTRGFAEWVFEDGGNGFGVDLERISITYNFNDALNVAAGRFHTPIGYLNSTYHHGALMLDTVARPDFLDFEDGPRAILPTHLVGLMATGKLSGKMPVGYEFGLGNGGSINTDPTNPKRVLQMNNVGDVNESKAVVLRVSAMPMTSTSVGIFAMHNNIAESGDASSYSVARGATLVNQNISGFDVNYDGPVNVLAEYYHLSDNNKVGSKESDSATAYFLQASMKIGERMRPVYRYESVSFKKGDEYFNILGRTEYKANILGMRFDLDDSNAIKVEAQNRKPTGGSDSTTFVVQWAFLIP